MAFVSVTRLRLRSRWYLLPFLYRTWRIVNQAKRADGFIEGRLARGGDPPLWRRLVPEEDATFWTITVWDDEGAMRAFRNADPHRRAMPKVLEWCDEASFVHWEQEPPELPDTHEALERMIEAGQPGRVRHPSESHARGEIPPEPALQAGPHLQPVTSESGESGS